MLTVQGTLDTVKAASPVNLAGTYVPGLGATLVSNTPTALVVDGYPVAVGDRVLLIAQTDALQNGIYDVVNPGSASVAWVLARSSDFDGHVVGQIKSGLFVFVANGNLNANTTWIQTASGTGVGASIILDTDEVVFTNANTVVYAFSPDALVYVVRADQFGIGKATVQSVAIAKATAVGGTMISYVVRYDNTARPTTSVDSSLVFADVNSAWVFYQPLIT